MNLPATHYHCVSLAEEVSDPSTMGGLCYNCPTLGESVVLVQTIEHKLCFVDMSKVVIDTAINLIFTETSILEKMTW